MGPPRAILFDWDNTLVDNWPTIHRALNAALEAMGQQAWSFDETLARVRQSMRDTFPAMFGERWQEARDIFYATFRATHLEELHPLGGAGDMLAQLAAQVPLGVVSNKGGSLLRAEAAHLDWARHFGSLVGAGDAPRDKPDPAPILMAAGELGLQVDRDVWYVGDAGIDMACARAAGCQGILVTVGRVHTEEAIDPPPDRHVKTFAELVALAAPQQDTI